MTNNIYSNLATTKKLQKEHFSTFSSIIANPNFCSPFITKTDYYTIERAHYKSAFSKKQIFLWPRVKNNTAKVLEELNKDIEILKESFKILEKFKLRTKIDVGEDFEPIYDISPVFGDEQKIKIERKEGQVLLIEFWSIWSEKSKEIEYSQTLFNKYITEWSDKVKLVAINRDDCKENIAKIITEKNWSSFNHYFLGGWNREHNAFKNYQIFSIPYCIIIDTKGKLAYSGYPNQVDKEKMILKLINNEDSFENQEKSKFKAFSKLLSIDVMNILQNEDFQSFKFDFSINWIRTTIYDEKGDFRNSQYQRPIMSLTYNIKDEEKINKMLEAIFEILPKELLQITITKTNPKEDFEFSVDTLKKQLFFNNLKEAQIFFEKTKSFNWNGSSFLIDKSMNFFSERIIKPNKFAFVENFSNNLNKILASQYPKRYEWLESFELHCEIVEGDDFFPFEVQSLLSDQKFLLKHEENQIMFVIFWTSWSEQCCRLMAYNEDMILKNKDKWKGKVRIISISLDESIEDASARIKKESWKLVEQYYIGENENIVNLYALKAFPEVHLVDSKGKILYKGHPSRIKPEEAINELIKGNFFNDESPKLKQINANILTPNVEEWKKLNSLLKYPDFEESLKKVIFNMKKKVKFSFNLKKTIFFDHEMKINNIKYHTPEMILIIRENDYPKFIPILNKIYSNFPQRKLNENKDVIETINISFGSKCDICQKKLKDFDPQYFCYFCKVWLCEKCGNCFDNSDTKKGNERLLHPHNMVWINISKGEGLEDIDEFKLGKNLIYSKDIQNYGAFCNGCSVRIRGDYRYICMNCAIEPRRIQDYIDLCQKCFLLLRSEGHGNENKFGIISKILTNQGHDTKSHLWLRCCYGDDYYNY